ncbi:hypothetical protein BD311DRAFT_167234 [Dichomitus squalens]|uniref:Uncharacterized protein n=1 Tax=Dichomitus squalens TaxID=114155 RepID=A0A4Q9M574_9APHY|nr:hypothetical protein BD311DRAFT_167234 [Dichomitus squalens]
MEATEPLPSILHPSNPPSLPHPRRRRTSLSGKLLNLFTTKPKSPPQPPPRPIISLPQPLPSRIPVPPKRAFREHSNDENAPLSPSSRPRVRLRLHSDTSVASVNNIQRSPSPERKIHTPPKGDRARPLKSALKKSASENTPAPFSPTHPTRTPPYSVHPPYEQESSASFPPATPSKPPNFKVTKRIPGGTWMPFSLSRNHATRAASEAGSPRSTPNSPPRKTVTFALEQPECSSSRGGLPHNSSVYDVSGVSSHWDEIAAELDTPATSVDASSHLKRKAEDYPDPNGGAPTFRPGSPTLTRSRKPVFTPQPSHTGTTSRGLSRSSGQQPHQGSDVNHEPVDIDMLMSQHVPPVPTLSAFNLPPRTFVGNAVDEWIEEYARERLRSPPPNTRAMAKRRDGPAGVIRRITADIVPNERHSTVWDANGRDTFAWGGTIVVWDANPASYFYPRHCIKGFQIEFSAIAEPRSGLDNSDTAADDGLPKYDWRTSYTGHKVDRRHVLQQLDTARGIAVEPAFVFVKPDNPDGPHAWLVHFWVPVPLSLFTRSVHRTFVCRAKVSVGGYGTAETDIPAGCVAVGIESLQSNECIAGLTSQGKGGRGKQG